MAFVTGTATGFSDLMTAIASALTSNGYTQSTNVFNKGSLYVDIQNVSTHLRIRGGTGKDGGDNLTGAPFAYNNNRLSYASLGVVGPAMAFSCTYFIQINASPDEVYIFVNDSTDRYSWMAFGQSPVSSLPGTGNWYAATLPDDQDSVVSTNFASGPLLANCISPVPGLFFFLRSFGGSSNLCQNCFFHHGLDSGINTTGWSGSGRPNEVGTENPVASNEFTSSSAQAFFHITNFYGYTPNTFNNQSVMFPIRPTVGRDSNKVSSVGELSHARYIRMDNYNPEEIITLGAEQWKIYPFVKKDSSLPLGSNAALTHSGTAGLAVRYDGP